MLEPSSSLLADLDQSISLTNEDRKLFRLYLTTSFGGGFFLFFGRGEVLGVSGFLFVGLVGIFSVVVLGFCVCACFGFFMLQEVIGKTV